MVLPRNDITTVSPPCVLNLHMFVHLDTFARDGHTGVPYRYLIYHRDLGLISATSPTDNRYVPQTRARRWPSVTIVAALNRS